MAMSGDEMGKRLAAVGGRARINCTLDYVEIEVQAPAEGFGVALDLLARAVKEPAFVPAEFAREKELARSALRDPRMTR